MENTAVLYLSMGAESAGKVLGYLFWYSASRLLVPRTNMFSYMRRSYVTPNMMCQQTGVTAGVVAGTISFVSEGAR